MNTVEISARSVGTVHRQQLEGQTRKGSSFTCGVGCFCVDRGGDVGRFHVVGIMSVLLAGVV